MELLIQEHVELAPLTTFRIGGPARFFVETRSAAETLEALRFARSRNLPIFVLGGGSNILVADEGFDGVVIAPRISRFEPVAESDVVTLCVGAGEDWDALVARTVACGWSGLECLSGIPGSVGAAPVQNIGAYGEEVSRRVVEVTALDTRSGEIVRIPNEQCAFGYRESIFNTAKKGRYIILEVVFRLAAHGAPNLAHQEIAARFGGSPPSAQEVRDAVIEIRAGKGFVPPPHPSAYRCAGSFFKNPVVERGFFLRVRAAVEGGSSGAPGGAWFWELPDGRIKVSAARLIECAGFRKGFRVGEAGISPKHALCLVNHGGAKAAEVIALARDISSAVCEKFGISLEPEVEFVGFSSNPLMLAPESLARTTLR